MEKCHSKLIDYHSFNTNKLEASNQYIFYIRNRDIYVMYPMIKVIEMYIAFEPFCEYSSKTTLEYQICPVRNIVKLSPFESI